MNQVQGRPARHCAGMTLPELLLGLCVLAMVGLGVATMLSAVAYGSSSTRDLRSLAVRHKTLEGRMAAAIRSARMVLYAHNHQVLIWIHDTNGSGLPSVSELRLLQFDPQGGRILASEADFAGLTAAQIAAVDVDLPLETNFNQQLNTLTQQSYFPAGTWSEDVTGFTFSLNDNNAQQASLIAYRLTVASGDLTGTVIGAAALRNAGLP